MKKFLIALLAFTLGLQSSVSAGIYPNLSSPLPASQGGLDSNSGPTGITKVIGFGDSTIANTAGGQVCYTATTFGTPTGTCLLDAVGIYYGAQVAQLGIGGTCNVKTTTASSGCNSANSGFARYSNLNTASSPGFQGLLTDPLHTLILISYTLNDAIKGDTAVTPTLFNTDLSTEVSYLLTQGVPSGNIVILGPSPIDPYGGSTPEFPGIPALGIQDALVARAYNTRFVDSYSILAGCFGSQPPYPIGPRCDTDGIHPSAAGEALLKTQVVNSTFSAAISGVQAYMALAAVWNQPMALNQRRMSSIANNQVGTVESFTGSLGIHTRGNPYEVWYNSAGTGIPVGPINDSIAGISGLIWEIKTSSPLFVLDGSGNGSFNGAVYGNNLTPTQLNLGSAGSSNTNGLQIGNTSTAGGAIGTTRIASIDGCTIGGLTATHALMSIDDRGAGYVWCLDDQKVMLASSLKLGTALGTAYGGTGSASPGLTAGTGLSVSGSFPTQQFALSIPVSAPNGGTGQTSYTQGDLLCASSSSALGKLSDVASGSVLASNGTGACPVYTSAPSISGAGLTSSSVPNSALQSSVGIETKGTWTPTDTSGASVPFTVSSARYVRNNHLVLWYFNLTYGTTSSGAAASISIPVTDQGTTMSSGSCADTDTTFPISILLAGGNFLPLTTSSSVQVTNAQLSTHSIVCSGTYESN